MRPNTALMLAALASVLGFAPGVAAQTPEMVAEIAQRLALKQLQGAWVPDLLVTPEGAEKYPLGGRVLLFNGKDFCRAEGKRVVASGTFAVEDGLLKLTVSDRNQWDLEAGTPAKGGNELVQYAYKIDEDVMTLCFTTGNKGKAGDLTPGEGRQVVIYKRQRDDRTNPAKH